MKLAEAAHVLGISLEDVTTDSLNKTYKKLIMAWDPEKSKDPLSKQKYVQITEAYKKLSSVMEGKDVFRGDEQHEIAAFMRMFMDMVGMSESDSLPTAAMTFGMMFGAPQSAMEEWSTDEDGEGDYDEEDEDDDEEDEEDDEDDEEGDFADNSDDHGDDEEDYPHLSSPENNNSNGKSSSGAANPLWEPQAKSYSPMNLKDQISREEEERKLKQAKKRADKRKKQKERKLREAVLLHRALGNTVDEQIVVVQSKRPAPAAKEPRYTPEELERLVSEHKQRLREELVFAVQNGRLEVVERIVSFKFPKDMPAAVFEAVTAQLRKEMATYQLMHKCITDFSSLPASNSAAAASAGGAKKTTNASTGTGSQTEGTGTAPSVTRALTREELQQLSKRKVLVLERLLRLTDPPLDLNGSDESGLSVLHRAAQLGDVEYLRVVARVIDASLKEPLPEKRKTTLNLNSRCHKKGWAAIHYAVEKNNLDVMRLLAEAGANLQATSATDKRLTPMELAKTKLKLAGSNTALKETTQGCIDELTRLIARQKAVEKEKLQQQSAAAQTQPAAQTQIQAAKQSETATTTATAVKETSEKKTKGKEKEKDKGKSIAAVSSTADKTSKGKANEAPSVSPPVPAPVPVAPAAPAVAAATAASGKAEKKKLKKAEKERAAAAAAASASTESKAVPASLSAAPAVSAPSSTAGSTASKAQTQSSAQTKNDKAAAKKDAKNNSSSTPAPVTAASLSLVSRDEMVDRLLAMGFREADCLSAIALYGTDFDMAISYLVDRPVELPESSSKPAPAAVAETDKSGALQQKKEELRRINRAWNAKAEDEKRKLEQQRRLAEEAKLKEAATPHKASPDVSESVPVFVAKAPHSAVKESPAHVHAHAHTHVTSSSSLPPPPQQQKSSAPVHVSAPPAPQSLPAPPMYAHTHTYGSAKQFHPQNAPTHAHFAPAAAGSVHAHPQMHALAHTGYAYDPMHSGYAVPVAVGVSAPTPPVLSRASSSTGHKVPAAPGLHPYAPVPVPMSGPPGIAPAVTSMSSTSSAQESAESTTDTYLTGAIELSAKAKPFVPNSFTPASLAAVPASTPSPAPVVPPPTPPPVGPLLPSTPISTTTSGSSLNPLLSSPGSAPIAFPSMLSGVAGDSTSSLLPPGLGGSLLGGLGSTGSLSSLDGGGLGLGTGSLWGNTSVGVGGISGGLGSSVSLGGVDSFAGLGSLSSSNFLSGILGSELGLDGSDTFDFDANMKDLDNLLGSSDFFSDLK